MVRGQRRGFGEADGVDFIGNVEGRDLLSGDADVVVTDGFTGNVVLKTIEGTARAVADAVRAAARSGPLAAAGGLLLRPALGGLRRQMDPDGTGGAILLGLRGRGGRRPRQLGPRRNRQRDPAGGAGGARSERSSAPAELLERSGTTRGNMRDSDRKVV